MTAKFSANKHKRFVNYFALSAMIILVACSMTYWPVILSEDWNFKMKNILNVGSIASGSEGRKLGVWLPIQSVERMWKSFCSSSSSPYVDVRKFADDYFHTPPYFAVVELLFDSIDPVVWDDYAWIKWVKNLATIGDSEGFQILIMFAFVTNDEEQWASISTALNILKGHSSIAYIGIDGEYMSIHGFPQGKNHDTILSAFVRYKQLVESKNMNFGSHYYISPFVPYLTFNELKYLGPWMGHTNYPFEGEPEYYLSEHNIEGLYNGQTVGIWNAADTANWDSTNIGKVFQHWSQLSDSVRKYGIFCGYLDSDRSYTYLDSNWRNIIYNLQRNYPNLITME